VSTTISPRGGKDKHVLKLLHSIKSRRCLWI
jgi:hypothetical protein